MSRPISTKTTINYGQKVTQRKFGELQLIATRYTRVKNEVFHKYGSINGLQYLDYPRQIRDEWVQAKFATKFELPARLWKQALDEAFSNIKSNWSNGIKSVKGNLVRNTKFTKDEKHYAYYLLKSRSLLYQAITLPEFPVPEIFNNLPIRRDKIHQYLKRQLRASVGHKPYQMRTRSFMLDSFMYDFKVDQNDRLWIGIMGLTKGKRIHVRLSSKRTLTEKGNLRIVLNRGNIEVHQPEKIEVPSMVKLSKDKKESVGSVVAIDKGFTEVIVSTSGKRYGNGFGKLLILESDRLSKKNAQRNTLRDLAKMKEKQGMSKTSQNIWVHNLGNKKYQHQKMVQDNKIKTFINTSLKKFFEEEMPSAVICENLNFTYDSGKNMSKAQRRRLSHWMKGYLHERLIHYSQIYGVDLEAVNPAYTSQICHQCHTFGKRNGDKFYCATHGVMSADDNACWNIQDRYYDPEIMEFTPYRKVKSILEARLRLSNQDLKVKTSLSRAN